MKKADELSKKRATIRPANGDERRIIIYQQQEHEVNSTMNYETWHMLRNNKDEEKGRNCQAVHIYT